MADREPQAMTVSLAGFPTSHAYDESERAYARGRSLQGS